MLKKFMIVGNWKLNGNSNMILHFVKQMMKYINKFSIKQKIVVVPPILYAQNIQKYINHKKIFLGAQNVDKNTVGAFTGEISISMLKDIGIKYVIIGHSERRKYHGETNSIIAKKFLMIKKYNLIPILCIGENIQEYQNKQTKKILSQQIDIILKKCGNYAFHNSIIAYEPIWSIGTGCSAHPKYIEQQHLFIKKYITDNSNINFSKIYVQYGGSVDENNIIDLINMSNIDGVLLGKSAIIYKKFFKIINIVNNFS